MKVETDEHIHHRPYILDQYNALLKRYENILEELHTSPLLKQMLVQPKTLENVDRIRRECCNSHAVVQCRMQK